MQSFTIPFIEVNYINFSKEKYEKTVYNRIEIAVKCEGELRANLSFFWSEEDGVPTELVEFIKNTNLNIAVN